MIPDNQHIQGAFFKAIGYLDESKNIAVSVSGGSDSDIVVDFLHQCNFTDKVHFFFIDTGIEYKATKDHIDALEDKYGITIDRIKANKSIPDTVKKYGIPFISKNTSTQIQILQQHDFTFEDRPLDELIKDYPGCRYSIRWWCNDNRMRSGNIAYKRGLKEFLIENPPNFPVSALCCKFAKKDTAKDFYAREGTDVVLLGLRKSEGGPRSFFKSCYKENKHGPNQYNPIYWFTDKDKSEYCACYGVCHSECYTRYGLRRTGCVGCPFSLTLRDDLKIIKTYEPKLYKVCNNVFGKSYEYTKRFYEFRMDQNNDKTRKKLKTPSLEAWGVC